MTHGYLLTGSGSNVYVQNLCRALVRRGHTVDLLCQEPKPMKLDFVNGQYEVALDSIKTIEERPSKYPGECRIYRPEIGGLLPVYVYDDYPGWRVKTFLDLTDDEFDDYVRLNSEAIQTVARRKATDFVVTNHSVPGPMISAYALKETGIPYASIVHGSCLQYVARRSAKYMEVAREGLDGATKIISPSPHGAGTIREDFPELSDKTLALSGGVDTELFTPKAKDASVTKTLSGGEGRGEAQAVAMNEALQKSDSGDVLLGEMEKIARSYHPRAHDRDAGERLEEFLAGDAPLVLYVGKLIHSKGVHSLISAFCGVRERLPDARLLVVGFGTFREGLEAIVQSLSSGDAESLSRLVALGKRLEGQSDGSLEHFEVGAEIERSVGLSDSVLFTGPLDHGSLAKIIPFADVAVVPSIFPEIFGLVAAEFAACGVVPFVARHSGLAEAGAIVGRGLPFDTTFSTEGFERNLTDALVSYLSLPEEERNAASRTVRENSERDLSWLSLAEEITELARLSLRV